MYLHSLLHLPFNRRFTTINFENRILSRPIILSLPSPRYEPVKPDKLVFIDITVIIGPGPFALFARFLLSSNSTRIIEVNALRVLFFSHPTFPSLQTHRSRYIILTIFRTTSRFSSSRENLIYSSTRGKENYSRYAAGGGVFDDIRT